jgi:hypothetical protein
VEALRVRAVRVDDSLLSEAQRRDQAEVIAVIRTSAERRAIERLGRHYDPKAGDAEIVLQIPELDVLGPPSRPDDVTLYMRAFLVTGGSTLDYGATSLRVGRVQTATGEMHWSRRAPEAANDVTGELINRIISTPEQNQTNAYCREHPDSPECAESPFGRDGRGRVTRSCAAAGLTADACRRRAESGGTPWFGSMIR